MHAVFLYFFYKQRLFPCRVQEKSAVIPFYEAIRIAHCMELQCAALAETNSEK